MCFVTIKQGDIKNMYMYYDLGSGENVSLLFHSFKNSRHFVLQKAYIQNAAQCLHQTTCVIYITM